MRITPGPVSAIDEVRQITVAPKPAGTGYVGGDVGQHLGVLRLHIRDIIQAIDEDHVLELVALGQHLSQAGDLAAGDYVRVNVRAARDATLAEIEAQPSGLVGDHGTTLETSDQPLYNFRGTLTSATSSAVTVHVTGGDGRAMKLLIGQSADQTFTVGGETIFLLWQGKVPTVIDASKLVVGDKIVVRIRADKGSSLSQVEATAATHVGDREPASK